MLQWNPGLYRQFEDERTRPAAELLARVPLADAAYVVDLGCGPGNSTELLAARFPKAHVLGVDNSESMLADARERLPAARFEWGDIAQWQAPLWHGCQPDLIYANAALQWVPDHEVLLPRLLAMLAPGGVLAVQMPDNRDEPTHRLMREVAGEAPWVSAIGDPNKMRTDLLKIGPYYDLLSPHARVDVWHTIYQHPMADAKAIVDWVRGTGLRPFLQPLGTELADSFVAEYTRRVDAAYPARADGRRLLAFPRMFMVAQRPL
ncbi:MAG: trans-aconitate 2-methyltransferase [Comamonas sp.]